MANSPYSQEEGSRVWNDLYPKLVETLKRFGVEDEIGDRDFWVHDDFWGYPQHKIYFNSFKMLQPSVINELRKLLQAYPAWEFMVSVSIGEESQAWPTMGLTIRKHEIVDGLQRQYFPLEYRSIQYEGSRVGTDQD